MNIFSVQSEEEQKSGSGSSGFCLGEEEVGWIMRQCYLGARGLSYCYGRDMKAFEKFKLVRFLLLKCHPLREDARNADFTA